LTVRSNTMADRATEKRRDIMRAAEELFADRRYHEVTLDAVARIARVSKGTIYNYFSDKQDLFFQLVISGFDDLCGVLEGTLPPGAGFREQLDAAAREITRFFAERRPLMRMMIAETGGAASRRPGVRDRWLEHRGGLVDAVACIMKRGIADGEVRAKIPARALAGLFLGLLRSRAHDREHTGIPPVSDRALVDLFCKGACGEAGCEPGRNSTGKGASRRRPRHGRPT